MAKAIALNYILVDDYYTLAIELPEDDDRPIGKWGRDDLCVTIYADHLLTKEIISSNMKLASQEAGFMFFREVAHEN